MRAWPPKPKPRPRPFWEHILITIIPIIDPTMVYGPETGNWAIYRTSGRLHGHHLVAADPDPGGSFRLRLYGPPHLPQPDSSERVGRLRWGQSSRHFVRQKFWCMAVPSYLGFAVPWFFELRGARQYRRLRQMLRSTAREMRQTLAEGLRAGVAVESMTYVHKHGQCSDPAGKSEEFSGCHVGQPGISSADG